MQNQQDISQQQWNILKVLEWTTSYFRSYNIDSPRAAAEILLAHALKLRRIDLYLKYDQPLLSTELKAYKSLIRRRAAREPIAYITGSKEFWSMKFFITKDVLIPRPETEILVESVLSLLSKNQSYIPYKILDIGTGSGAIITAIAAQYPKYIFFASDKSYNAILTAKKNAKLHNLDNAINFFVGDWFKPLKDKSDVFDIIVSNPPYITTQDIKATQPEIFNYEPIIALDGGKDGLDCIRHIVFNAHNYLKSDGHLFIEIGFNQKDRILNFVNKLTFYKDIYFIKDYLDYDRVLVIKK